MDERDVVGLVYQADWTKLTLTGTVRGAEPPTDTVTTVETAGLIGRPADSSWLSGRDDLTCALTVAPGRRFRVDADGGDWAAGSDGARMWHWYRERRAGLNSINVSGPQIPYLLLLAPAWLLTGYALTVEGQDTVLGRPAIRVSGTARAVAARPDAGPAFPARSVSSMGALLYGLPRWLAPGHGCDAVEAVVDAELGILLRCVRRRRGAPPEVTEFLSVTPGLADPRAFSAPPGSIFVTGPGLDGRDPGAGGPSLADEVGEALGTAAKQAAKAAAGIAAGGLGALVKYGPRRRTDPFARATTEGYDPEAEMPADEPAPGPDDAGDARLPLDVLHLLYRAGLAGPSFQASLHQWYDPLTALQAVPRSAREAGFGGVGFLVDAIRESAREDDDGVHEVSTVRMDGWRKYRIDNVPAAGQTDLPRPRHRGHARTIASDGTRHWEVLDDKVVVTPAAPPPGDLTGLLDPSWMLGPGLILSGGSEVSVAGRRAYRVVVRYQDEPPRGDHLRRLVYPAVAVVDAETGRLLRLSRFIRGRPSARQELRDLAPLDADADFGFTPPDGLRVEEHGTGAAG